MEIEEEIARYTKQGEVEMEPPLLHIISSNKVDGFDTIQENQQMIDFDQPTPSSSHLSSLNVQKVETVVKNGWHNGTDTNAYDRTHQASMSMPVTPLRHSDPATPKKVLFNEQNQVISDAKLADVPPISGNVKKTKPKFYSQPMPASVPRAEATETTNNPPNLQKQDQAQRSGDRPRDNRFDNFKTWSGKLEKLATFRVKPVEQPNPEQRLAINTEGNLRVDRYFDALQGPDLDRLRPSEELMLPDDKSWPFLLRFPVASFGICLGVSSQAILWKTIATSISKKYIHLSEILNILLWFVSIALMAVVTLLYALKLIFYFEAVRREYYHPIRVNFFFAPFITLLFLALGVPPSITKTLPQVLWYILMVPFLCLELKIYGQWMSGGQRRLSKVANPSNHLSVVGNFVGSLLGASMGLKEGPLFFFAVGLAHYTVLFVTLYQRLPTNETLPKELHPVFFLFVAAPSVASMAWARIQGSFDNVAKIAYFIAIFLYFSLAVRISFFRGIRFSLTWWAYTFPMTGAAIATIRYANAVTNWATRSLAVALSIVSMLTVTALLVTTLLQAFVFRKLFPNDFAIAISDKPPRSSHSHHRKWFHHFRHGSSDTKEIEHYLKFIHPADSKDLESSVEAPSSH